MTSFPSSRRPASLRRGFTLIELLVVVAIMGVMMALIMPSFRGFGRGAAMKSAISQIRTTMSLARQNAVTKRQFTFVAFAGADTVADAPKEAWRAYRSYAVWVTLNSDAANPSGLYLKGWTALPPGVVITDSSLTWPGTGHGDNVLVSGMDRSIPFPTATGSLVRVKVLQYTTEGAVNTSGREVYLTEGTVETNGLLSVKPNAVKHGVEAHLLTGQIRVKDYNY
jgi:prepilin-type N-terminal cleavage/methylation domain-containing protein